MSGRFGLNLSFCVKRWVTPALWAPLVREDLGVDLVQLSFDLVDPMWPDALLDRQAEAIRRETAAHGVTVHSAFIGLAHYTYSQLLHPEREVRDVAEAWLGRAYRFAALAGIPSAGGPLGAIASRPDGHEADAIDAADYADLLTRMHRLAGVAKGHGLSELYVEPTPMRREWPSTIAQAEQMMADVRAAALPGATASTGATRPSSRSMDATGRGWKDGWSASGTTSACSTSSRRTASTTATGTSRKPGWWSRRRPWRSSPAPATATSRSSSRSSTRSSGTTPRCSRRYGARWRCSSPPSPGPDGVAETLTGARPGGDTTLLRLDELDAERVRARVTWYYYVGGLTQQEIADRPG